MEGYPLTNHKAVPILACLSEDDYELIRERVRIHAVPKGEVIFHSGEPAALMYILYRGSMKISAELTCGREQILYIYKKGEFVGGLNLLSGDYYAYNAIALEDSFVVTVTSQDFRNVMLQNAEVLRHILEMSYERIRFSETLIDVLSTPSADERVAKVLLNLMTRFGKADEAGTLIQTNLNREEMGSYAGVTRETMSRKIHQFESEGILSTLPKGDLLILDEEALAAKLR